MFVRLVPPVAFAAALASFACSPATVGLNRMAAALGDTAAAYARDDDPEFVRAGAPATLKMVETMLDSQPSHPTLLMTACSGFTQYAYGFLHVDSELAAVTSPAEAAALRDRGARMYVRARGYCMRALRLRHPRLAGALERDLKSAAALMADTTIADVPALFWTAAAWAGELSLVENQLVRIEELAVVRTLMERALTLDEGWQRGAIHEAMIALDGLPPILGGSAARAREHFKRTVALSEGQSALAYVTMASSVSVRAKDRMEFERLLQQAMSIDTARPELRLQNAIARKRARFLLANADRLFD